MTKLIPALVLAALPAAAYAADAPIAFERDGIHYVATDHTYGKVRLIEGHEVETGKTFSLRVVGNRVRGRYGLTDIDAPVGARSTEMAAAGVN